MHKQETNRSHTNVNFHKDEKVLFRWLCKKTPTNLIWSKITDLNKSEVESPYSQSGDKSIE